MKKLAILVAVSVLATPAMAMPVAPINDDGEIVLVAKKSSRSAVTGKFVTRGYAKRNKSTTVTHGKY